MKHEDGRAKINKHLKHLDEMIAGHQTSSDEIPNSNQIKKFEERIKELENNKLPLGYIYFQLPGTLAPEKLWPTVHWSEVTFDYSGLFFRAEGGKAAKFGDIQEANSTWISNMHSVSYYYDSWSGPHATGTYCSKLDVGKWSMNANPTQGLMRSLYFYTTGGENRPRNTAIKIWKRIE